MQTRLGEVLRETPAGERRLLPRIPIERPITLRTSGDGCAEHLGTTDNASADGMFLFIDDPIPQGTRVEVFLTLLVPESGAQIHVWCSGEVVRTTRYSGDRGFGIAVAFHEREIIDRS